MTHCPFTDRLPDLLAGEPSGTEANEVEAHVETCAGCQQALERLTAVSPAGRKPSTLKGSGADFLRRLEDDPPAAADRATLMPQGPSWPTPIPGAEAPPAGARGTPFGRYLLLRSLGRGGMGTVYLAHDTQLDRLVALKQPHVDDDGGPLAERFLREARAAASLHHPNICPVHDYGCIDGRHYLTMAFIDGVALPALLDGGKTLPQSQAAAIVRQVALAVHEAHQHGILHRDLKPANVMLDRRGQPVVMDFGLARRLFVPLIDPAGLAAEPARLTRTGEIVGTPAYMPPEQVRADRDALCPASDVYSLGVILYELLTGRTPFEGTVGQILTQVESAPPVPPSRIRPDLDKSLEAVCLKALAKAAGDRFPTMAEFAAALAPYANVVDQPARPVVPADRHPSRRGPRWRWPVALGTAAAALLGVLLVLRPWEATRSRPEATYRPERPPATASGSLAELDEAIGRGRADAMAHVRRAWYHNDREQPDEAIVECNKALAVDSRCGKAYACRGNAYMRRGDSARAIADLDESLRLEPGNVVAYIDRAWSLNAAREYDKALADCAEAIRRKPGSSDLAEAYFHQGNAYLLKGLYEQAVESLTLAIQHKKDYAWAYHSRGKAYTALRKTELAEADLRKAVSLNPALER